MTTARKVKVSLTLSPDVLTQVDRAAQRTGTTRSYLVEQWLRAGASRAAERAMEDELIAYYQSRTAEQREEDDAIARASTRNARRIDYDAPHPQRAGRRRRR